MIPTVEDTSVYLGDAYMLQDNIIIGEVRAIKFRQYPPILLNHFFSAPDANARKHVSPPHVSPLTKAVQAASQATVVKAFPFLQQYD